ncbi:YajG family lipoprotein [Psychrosphaera aestuarii]|uniref:YajG family lipoprotein n=1 Tax=Psychrosphaera aestuarii TaxID=1266052 RepID=UPI001B31A40F|nr:YajG family lipoprotein [Psychrosphaera aestuarii]
MRFFQLIAISTIGFILSGCANQFEQAVKLAPSAVSPKLLMSVKDINISDSRENKAMAMVNSSEFMQVNNIANLIRPWLTSSLQTSPNGRNKLNFDITTATSYIKQYAMTFESEAVLEWKVTVSSPQRTWTKSYQTGINQDGPMKFDQEDVTKNMNIMLSTLLERTLQDDEFQKALSR